MDEPKGPRHVRYTVGRRGPSNALLFVGNAAITDGGHRQARIHGSCLLPPFVDRPIQGIIDVLYNPSIAIHGTG